MARPNDLGLSALDLEKFKKEKNKTNLKEDKIKETDKCL